MVEPNIMYEKEYYSLRHIIPETSPIPDGYINYDLLKSPQVAMMNLHGHQKFIENLFNPTTPYKRLLLYHGTGTGKTLIINAVAKTYIDYFKRMKQQPNIFIIGFTENIVIKDLMKYPELGYITRSEIEELNRLSTSNADNDIQRRRNLRASIRRRITDKAKGGYYKFYGYREFANHLFNITPKGVEAKITHSKIYDETDSNTGIGSIGSAGFSKRIDELIAKGHIELNRDLFDSLKYSLIACDEVHLTYNIKGKNSGGMSLKYMLDLLEKEDRSTAPRVLYGSATPLSGSPTEAVDLAELLVPLSSYNKLDYFVTVDPPKFKPDGVDRLGKLFDGYVSFLKDTTKDIYPTRIFDGVSIPGLPYLKFVECPMSNFQLNTLMDHKKHDPNFETLLSSESMSLYDIVFPNPDDSNKNIGLYNISDLESKINSAPDKWRQTAMIDMSPNTKTPSGQFLHSDNLGIYSTKYETLLESLIDLLDSHKPGKTIVYHYMVRGSGILLLYNMLLENGFIGATSAPISNTRCAVCGVIYKDHNKIKDHLYRPARVMLAYGELGNTLESNYNTFNSSDNINGYEYRILLASRVIHEGVDFKEIRYMYILSLPKDISTLIQLMGRAVRGYSHHRLPIDQRDVHISILVSTINADDKSKRETTLISPEVKNYQRKLALFLLIQEVEREMRRYAIDNFVNYTKMKDIADKASLEGLPYKPAIEFNESKVLPPSYISTFYNHGYAQTEIETLIIILKKLFAYQPIWTYKDLLSEVHDPKTMLGTIYDHTTFSESSFKIALAFLLDVTSVHLNDMTDLSYTSTLPYMNMGNSIRIVTYCDPYYILTGTDDIGAPILDYNQFMRSSDVEIYRSINVNLYVRSIVEQKEYNSFINGFMKTYEKFPELSIIQILPKYHYTLMSDIIMSSVGVNMNTTAPSDYKKVVKIMEPIYRELGILFTYDDFINTEVANSYGLSRSYKKPIGYRTGFVSYIYTNNTFVEIQSTLIQTVERKENDIVIGFMKIRDDTNMEFIMRQPIQQLVLYTDKRKINKGASCNTYSRAHRRALANKLKIELIQGPAMCEKIEMTLFKRELKARMGGNDSNRLRWFYLPMDIMPNLTLT